MRRGTARAQEAGPATRSPPRRCGCSPSAGSTRSRSPRSRAPPTSPRRRSSTTSPTKEDLVFSAAPSAGGELHRGDPERPAGTPLTEAFRARPTRSSTGRAASRSTTSRSSRAWCRQQRAARAAVPGLGARDRGARAGARRAAGVPEDDLVARVVARSLAWAHRLVFRAALEGLLAGTPARELAAELRIQADRAYDQLEQGLGGYGVASTRARARAPPRPRRARRRRRRAPGTRAR